MKTAPELLELFLEELGELSQKYGFVIEGDATIFIANSDDTEQKYTVDDESFLVRNE